MFRYRKSTRKYVKKVNSDVCPFCSIDPELKVQTHGTVKVMKNKFGYDVWEGRTVIDHLLVFPARHVRSLEELTKQERADMMDVMATYEAKDYNVYARSVDSVQRSVPAHQHTHLVKTDHRKPKVVLYVDKPYFMTKF